MKLSARSLARTPCKSTTQLEKVHVQFILGSESSKQMAKSDLKSKDPTTQSSLGYYQSFGRNGGSQLGKLSTH